VGKSLKPVHTLATMNFVAVRLNLSIAKLVARDLLPKLIIITTSEFIQASYFNKLIGFFLSFFNLLCNSKIAQDDIFCNYNYARHMLIFEHIIVTCTMLGSTFTKSM
jgi:hypothetical protein